MICARRSFRISRRIVRKPRKRWRASAFPVFPNRTCLTLWWIPNSFSLPRRASEASPTDTRPLLELGLLLDGTGRRDQAKPIYEQILKIQPDHPIALNNLAYIKAEEGVDLDSAITMAQRALQKAPQSTNIK